MSPATQSVSVTVTPLNGPSAGPFVGNCAQGFCTQSVPAPIGTDAFAVSLYQQTNANGNVLSSGTTTSTIVAGANNVVLITFNPVLQSASAGVATPLGAGLATSVPVTIAPLDPSGATIIGPGAFEDASGKPTTLAITLQDPTQDGSLHGQTTFASPAPNGVYPITLAENGTPPNFNYPSLVAMVGTTVSSTTLVPLFPAVNGTPTPVSTGTPIQTMTAGPNNDVWFVGGTPPNSALGQFVPQTGTIHVYPLPSGVTPSGLVTGGDGNLWFFDTAHTTFVQVTTNGLLRQFPASFVATNLIRGVDGDIWFITSQGSGIGKIASDGTISTYTVSPLTSVYSLTAAKNNHMYFVAEGGTGFVLASVAADGKNLESVAVSYPDGLPPYALYAGPDKNFYLLVEVGLEHVLDIFRITPAGVLTPACGGQAAGSYGTMLADGTLLFYGNVEPFPPEYLALQAVKPNGTCVYFNGPPNADLATYEFPVGLSVGYFYGYSSQLKTIARLAY